MIVLQILKIIGIVIGCAVGLVIFLLLVVLLAPIRYQMTGKGEDEGIEAEAVVTWLFGLVKAHASYREKKVSYRVRAAWKTLLEGSLGGEEAKDAAEVLQEELTEEVPEQKQDVSQPAEKKTSIKTAKSEEALSEEKALQERTPKKTVSEEKPSEKEAQETERGQETDPAAAPKEEPDGGTAGEKTKTAESEVKDAAAVPFKEKFRALIRKLKQIHEKIEKGRIILEAETTHRALKTVKVQLFHLLNHLKPVRISGEVCFGLDDPATTAILYGNLVPIADALSKGKLSLTPELEKKRILLDLVIKGRIFIGYMLLCVLRIVLNRDVQALIKAVRRYVNGRKD